MKLILSTSNIIGGATSILARGASKSNAELTAGLLANFQTHRNTKSTSGTTSPSYRSWTLATADELRIPTPGESHGLSEERSAYDITVKLFYLPNVSAKQRCQHTADAIALVCKELGVECLDLLILSFPGITFDADDESEDDLSDASVTSPATPQEDLEPIIQTRKTLEHFHDQGVIKKLGVSEFGTQRLSRLLANARIRPSVDQINVRDCCVVPKPLIVLAKEEGIELLTHNDCTDILPPGTLRELLGSGKCGVGVLADGEEDAKADGLRGEVDPLWVVKYTAVVKNRGVVENKGYFAVADLHGK